MNSFTPTTQSWINAANNRLVNAAMGIGYDTGGNLTSIGGYGWTYDAENRLTTSTISGGTATYVYDGDGRRVQKVIGGATATYVYDASGQLAAEYDSVAPSPAPCTTCYLTADHLGSTRMMTDASGTVQSLHDYLPFGEEIPGGAGGAGGRTTPPYPPSTLAVNDTVTEKFTGKERDAETGLDYFGARYLSSAQGRFTSPDPLLGSGRPSNPQSWNRYSYVLNRPLTLVDPDGLLDEDSFKVKQHNVTITYERDEVLEVNGKPSVYHYTVSWTADVGTVMADDGKTEVEVSKATSPIKVTVKDASGNENSKLSAAETSKLSNADNSTNCIGTAFADGKFWIEPNQVNKILSGDGYAYTGAPQADAVGVYSTKGYDAAKGKVKGDIHHAVTVAAVDSATKQVSGVTGKGGIQPNTGAIVPPGPGPGSAWVRDPKDKLDYFTAQ